MRARSEVRLKYDPFKHHRHSIRLKGYDYSQAGAYYVTIVVQNRACLFGNVADAEMQLNDAGRMVRSQWECLPQRFPSVELDESIVMPNHFHGIIVIADETIAGRPHEGPPQGGRPQGGRPQGSHPTGNDAALGEVIGAWKSIVTNEYIEGARRLNWEPFYRKLWQRNYWEHIIRDEADLNRIREYITNNPANWETDQENPKNMRRP